MSDTKIQFIRLPVVQDKTGLSKSSIYGMMNAGSFPRSVPIGARAVAWVAQEVDDWVAEKLANRTSATDKAA